MINSDNKSTVADTSTRLKVAPLRPFHSVIGHVAEPARPDPLNGDTLELSGDSTSLTPRIISDAKTRLNNIRENSLEELFCISNRGLVCIQTGTEKFVRLNREQKKMVREAGTKERVILGHNHPEGGPLSEFDMIQALKLKVTDMIAITPSGQCHLMHVPLSSSAWRHFKVPVAAAFLTLELAAIIPTAIAGIFIRPIREKMENQQIFQPAAQAFFHLLGARFYEFPISELPKVLSEI